MRGITNAPQGGSGGGDWTFHSGNDWSDILERDSSFDVVTKKEILLVFNTLPFGINTRWVIIPKGFKTGGNLSFNLPNAMIVSGGNVIYYKTLYISSSDITGSNVDYQYMTVKGTADLNTGVITFSETQGTSTISKSQISVYYKD